MARDTVARSDQVGWVAHEFPCPGLYRARTTLLSEFVHPLGALGCVSLASGIQARPVLVHNRNFRRRSAGGSKNTMLYDAQHVGRDTH